MLFNLFFSFHQDGAKIPGIRRWEPENLPSICDFTRVDEIVLVCSLCFIGTSDSSQVNEPDTKEMARKLAREEGLFCGVSSAGAVLSALRLSERPDVENATIVVTLCDWGDRYLSSGVFTSK